jgi:hypothetical protein
MDPTPHGDTPDATSLPEWLKRLQQESWQAEILISGAALVGLTSLANNAAMLKFVFDYGTTLTPEIANPLTVLINFVILVLLEGFTVHLILRGYWIGLVGLNYVFPEGVRTDKLRFKGKFGSLFKDASNTNYLIKLDMLGSVVFAFTFLAMFSTISLVSFAVVLTLLSLYVDIGWPMVVLTITTALLAILQLIDFLTLGRLKRKTWFARIFYPVYLVLSLITLSFLYRRLYYTMVSNIKPIYFFVVVTLPIAVLFLVLPNTKADSGTLSKRFASINGGSEKRFLSLPEPIVRDSLLEFTINHFPRLEEEIVDSLNVANSRSLNVDSLGFAESIRLTTSRYRVFVDSIEVKNLHWLPRYYQGETLLHARTLMFTSTINIKSLRGGTHQLGIRINSKANEFQSGELGFFAVAYFVVP